MEKDDTMALLFFITGLASFIFDGAIYVLDGEFSQLFTWIGVIATSLGLLLFFLSKVLKQEKE